MIGMKNRCIYIQFVPNKRHARFGVKKFELCDSPNAYVYHIELYAGKDFDIHHAEGQAFAVVDHLMRTLSLLSKGYKLFTDIFYTKPKLAQHLYQQKTHLCGTVRVEVPPAAAPRPQAVVPEHRLVLLEGRKEMRCYVCSTPQDRWRSRSWCPACKVGCHEQC
ncbi:PiggyBac transposable element-derived protein 4-like [Elysia marginata]|uniref:PiggyBac transposable element-derived protein 4-like n=1 Tax=Elysia marginata TaxID=1093978 RepID=A0AAV4JPI4_9GAST|nr:PiggyBac transposable element-derived protein 4-like [Elysia marginata]